MVFRTTIACDIYANIDWLKAVRSDLLRYQKGADEAASHRDAYGRGAPTSVRLARERNLALNRSQYGAPCGDDQQ